MTEKHWTEESIEDFVFSIRFDLAFQLEQQMERLGWNDKTFAEAIHVSKGRMSQILNGRGNMTLRRIVECARALGIKVSIVAYDDGDSENMNGPIPSAVFNDCWKRSGKPHDMWGVRQFSASTNTSVHPKFIVGALLRPKASSTDSVKQAQNMGIQEGTISYA